MRSALLVLLLAGIALPACDRQTSPPDPAPTVHVQGAPSPPWYANCAAVRAAGKAPLHRGKPGYRPALDRDGDGVACDQ